MNRKVLTMKTEVLNDLEKGVLNKVKMEDIHSILNQSELTDGIEEGLTALSLCLIVRSDVKDMILTPQDTVLGNETLVLESERNLEGYFLLMENLQAIFNPLIKHSQDIMNVIPKTMMLPIGVYVNRQGVEPFIVFQLIIDNNIFNESMFVGEFKSIELLKEQFQNLRKRDRIYLETLTKMEV